MSVKGVRFSDSSKGKWREQVFNGYKKRLLDQLLKYGKDDTYGNWLNEMQDRHYNLYSAANASGNWQNVAYENEDVGRYLLDYRGGRANDNTRGRFGKVVLKDEDNYDFNQTGIRPNQNTRYITDGVRTSGDFARNNYNYNIDNYFSAITDDRRLLGREEDWDDLSINEFNNELKNSGWKMELDPTTKYYKLKRINPDNKLPVSNGSSSDNGKGNPSGGKVEVGTGNYNDTLNKPKFGNILGNLIGSGRILNTLRTNARVYNSMKKATFPVLQQGYHTYRQIVGNQDLKQKYYERAAQGQTAAALPFTSDADKLMAYQQEARRVANQLRAEGDLVDNKEIRRTSDESMNHAWQNTARDTQIANENITSIAKARAAAHQLDAQKYSALGTSIDNLLKEGQLNALRNKQERLAYLQKLDSYDYLLNEPSYLKLALDNYDNAYTEYSNATTTNARNAAYTKLEEAEKALKIAKIKRRREWDVAHPPQFTGLFGKNGGKIDKDAEMLYKSTRDAVKHFREMSKQTDNSRIKTLPKAIKLKGHPSTKKSKKLQYGGQAPFMVYTPLALGGGESTTASATSSTSSKSKGKEDTTYDVVKDLFKDIAGKGLLSDVNQAYMLISRLLTLVLSYDGEIDPDDLASLYLKQLLIVNNLQLEKSAWDDALKRVDLNKGLNELAVDNYGRLVVLDKDGNLSRMTLLQFKESEGKVIPLTNNLVLQQRKFGKPFDHELLEVVNNGVGLEKINEYIKASIGTLGTNEIQQEGYSKKQTQELLSGINNIKKLAESTQGAPDGVYKETSLTREQKSQAEAALEWVYATLPDNMKTVLSLHGDPKKLIAQAIIGKTSYTLHYDISAETGKAAKGSSGSNKTPSSDNNSAGLAFVLGLGPRELISFNTGSSEAITVLGIKGVLQTKSNENLGQGSTLQDATKSQQGGYLKWNQATFGGSRLNPSAYSHIILNDSTIMGMDLPYTTDLNGNQVPDFLLLKVIERADEEIQNNDITDPLEINKVYLKYGLEPKFTADGKLNTLSYKRFAAIQATLDEQSLLNKEAILSDEVAIAGDVERDLYEEIMNSKSGSSKNKYSLDDGFFGWGKDQLYKGTIFIPYDEDIAFAAISSGKGFDQELPNDVAEIQLMQYAPKAKSYVAPPKTVSQLKE